MKKILILLMSLFSFSFAMTSSDFYTSLSQLKVTNVSISTYPLCGDSHINYSSNGSKYYISRSNGKQTSPDGICSGTASQITYDTWGWSGNPEEMGACAKGSMPIEGGDFMLCTSKTAIPIFLNALDNGFYSPEGVALINPDPLGGRNCREGFVKDGQYYNCNPNLNQAELVPNSDDYILDENQNSYPKCNQGFVNDSTLVISGGGTSYTKQSCVVPAPDPETGSGTSNPVLDGVTTTTNADGSTTITWGDGTTQTVQTNGNSVTTYPDGTKTSSGGSGSTGGGSGSTGGGSGSTGGSSGGSGSSTPPSGANTPNETNPNTNDTPVDTAPVANSCTSSNLTLQEKMMCEMNAGMKKLNSESSTQNSLNNLLKDLNSSNSQSLTAINKNVKYTNDNLEVINKNTNQTNQNLEVVANKVNQSNSELKAINETLKNIQTNTKDTSTNTSRTISVGGGTGETSGDGESGQLTSINNNLQDAEGKAHLETISNSLKSIFGAGTDGTGNSEQGNQLRGNFTGTLNSTFSKYSNVLGFGSGFGNPPSNITLVLFGTTYTLIDFSLLEQHVSIIRALFLSLAYLYGFLFFLRGGK